MPENFDGGVETCAEYVSTAVPTDYSIISALGGFCTAVGDVLDGSATTTRAPLTGGGVSAATSIGDSNSPAVTRMPSPSPNEGGPVTVTAGPGPTNIPTSGGVANRLSGMFGGVIVAALAVILFL